jgi:uncharacterized protein (DUF1501 family)
LERASLINLTEREALHPSLKPLMTMWEGRELAVIQGLGYPNPNLSHFRSIEIWDTASKSEEYLDAGWLARTFAQNPAPKAYAADGVVVGSNDMGPLSGYAARTIALARHRAVSRARHAWRRLGGTRRNSALRHILSVGKRGGTCGLQTEYELSIQELTFPTSAFAGQVRTAAQLAGPVTRGSV